MIVQIVSLLLLFMTEAEAFCCIKSMVEISRHYLKHDLEENNINNNDAHHGINNNPNIYEEIDLREMRWYFTFDSNQFSQLCGIFFEEVKAKDHGFSKILKHFTNLKYKYMHLFEEWVKTLYLIHLPLAVFLIKIIF